jgi:alpha-ketoglutarate-dependent taurine dioxygenase
MSPQPDFKIGAARRRAVSVTQRTLTSIELLEPGQGLPLVVRPAIAGVDLVAWAGEQRQWIQEQLQIHGALLLRGFRVGDAQGFERLIAATSSGGLLEYKYRSTPRSNVSGRIYTSTEYPPDQFIPWHNENSYARQWPMKLYFYSKRVAEKGGETPLVDARRVFQRVPAAVRDRFAEAGVKYVRNYRPGLDLPWQTVFQTDDRTEVESFCRRSGIEFEWRDDGTLHTSQVCQGVAPHPATGEMVWFNQAHLFHVSALPTEIRYSLLDQFGEDGLPRNAYFGDGKPLEAEVLDEIRRLYQEEQVAFPWQEEDVTIIDNMLVAHGRMPYEGADRRVLVGMAEAIASES